MTTAGDHGRPSEEGQGEVDAQSPSVPPSPFQPVTTPRDFGLSDDQSPVTEFMVVDVTCGDNFLWPAGAAPTC